MDSIDYLHKLREEAIMYGKSNYFLCHYQNKIENNDHWDYCWTSEWNILHLFSFKTPTKWAELSEQKCTGCASYTKLRCEMV